MSHQVLIRISDKIRKDWPAEALQLLVAAREMQRLETMANDAVETSRVLEFKPRERV
jgi:hypothetical protein